MKGLRAMAFLNGMLKKAPKDIEPNHPAIENLKLKSFTASQKIDDNLFTDINFNKVVLLLKLC